jgi:hypothetical protein
MRLATTGFWAVGAAVLMVGCMSLHGEPVTGTTTLTSATADPCRGSSFDADVTDARCLHPGTGTPAPAPAGLRIALPSAPVARSGYDAGVIVEMTNTTSEPMALEVGDSCGTFEGQASNASTNSFESDCFGVCGNGPEPHVLRVTLEPGGVVRKKVKFYAVQTKTAPDEGQECVTRTMGGLPPGEYALRVTLPWTDPIAEDPGVTRPKVLEGRITVTP